MTEPTEYILASADARHIYFYDGGQGGKVVEVTDHPKAAYAWPTRREAEAFASTIPGRWVSMNMADAPARKP